VITKIKQKTLENSTTNKKGGKTQTQTRQTTIVVCYFAHSKNEIKNMTHQAD
jgi:hypothetical protein